MEGVEAENPELRGLGAERASGWLGPWSWETGGNLRAGELLRKEQAEED